MEITVYLMGLSLLFTFIAACISIMNWMQWKKMELDTMKARVFLDSSFVINNFKLTFLIVLIVGAVLSSHSVMEYFQIAGINFEGFDLLYYGMLPLASGVLMLMAYIWYKLINVRSKQV